MDEEGTMQALHDVRLDWHIWSCCCWITSEVCMQGFEYHRTTQLVDQIASSLRPVRRIDSVLARALLCDVCTDLPGESWSAARSAV